MESRSSRKPVRVVQRVSHLDFRAEARLAAPPIGRRTEREHSPRGIQSCQWFSRMPSAPNPQSDADQLEAAADQAIAACGGDAREAVKALIVANQFSRDRS